MTADANGAGRGLGEAPRVVHKTGTGEREGRAEREGPTHTSARRRPERREVHVHVFEESNARETSAAPTCRRD